VEIHSIATRWLGALSVIAMTLALLVAPASVAKADRGDSPAPVPSPAASFAPEATLAPTQAPSCPAGTLCVWVNINYGGARDWFEFDNANWGVYNEPTCPNDTLSNCASSLFNNGRECNVRTYDFTNYGGAGITWARGAFDSNLVGNSFNDRISSNNWCV
jgi:hypothetical protein